jgi:ABC-type Fe3+-hydroxamate transport system substrate-binding protein
VGRRRAGLVVPRRRIALSQIAPTSCSESSGTEWTSQVGLTREALNHAAEADALLAEFDERAAADGEAIGATGKTAVNQLRRETPRP